VGLLTLAAGCGKSEEEKQEERARNAAQQVVEDFLTAYAAGDYAKACSYLDNFGEQEMHGVMLRASEYAAFDRSVIPDPEEVRLLGNCEQNARAVRNVLRPRVDALRSNPAIRRVDMSDDLSFADIDTGYGRWKVKKEGDDGPWKLMQLDPLVESVRERY
jgi:hypothetical protein